MNGLSQGVDLDRLSFNWSRNIAESEIVNSRSGDDQAKLQFQICSEGNSQRNETLQQKMFALSASQSELNVIVGNYVADREGCSDDLAKTHQWFVEG